MNENLKTIPQIAQELGVSRQTIYNKLNKDKAFCDAVKAQAVNVGKSTLYTSKGQELIKSAFNYVTYDLTLTYSQEKFDTLSEKFTDCKEELTTCKNELDRVSKELTTCKIELDTKDKIINELNVTIAELKAKAQDFDFLQSQLNDLRSDKEFLKAQLSDVTTALKAAQALHGIENQKKTIAVKAQDKPRPSAPRGGGASSHGAAVRSKKRSLFERLFKR